MLDKKLKFQISPSVALQELNGISFRAFDIENGDVYELNETSFHLLKLFRESNDFDTITDVFLNEYEVSEDELKQDLYDTLMQFLSLNIIISGEI